ncbi:hypothetical protein LY76DRAFT_321892 [Colletotrichum caudatum]|nr:hypothetical protein LY76DRAFT_321892 [Colletotrichum caudatum]
MEAAFLTSTRLLRLRPGFIGAALPNTLPFPTTLPPDPSYQRRQARLSCLLACLLPRKENGTPPPSSPLQIIHQRRPPCLWVGTVRATRQWGLSWLLDCTAPSKKEPLMSPLSSNYRLTRFIFTNQRDRCRAASHKLANSSLRTTDLSTHGSLPDMMMMLLFENTGETLTECLLGLLDSPSRRGTRLAGWAGMANCMQQGTYLTTTYLSARRLLLPKPSPSPSL